MNRLDTYEINGAKRYIFQPGNGTRYEVVLVPDENSFLFGWVNGSGTIAEFGNTGLMTSGYFMDKLKLHNRADAAALMTLVNELTGRPVELPFGFDANGVYTCC
jgi:hypothetical protein